MILFVALLSIFVPNPTFTPGVARPLSVKQVCETKWGHDRRHVTIAMKRKVAEAYGIKLDQWKNYEFDHLISRELAGADDVLNLYPQSWTGEWNAHKKDRLENRMHRLVCAGELKLETAQHEIATDWIAAFKKHVKP